MEIEGTRKQMWLFGRSHTWDPAPLAPSINDCSSSHHNATTTTTTTTFTPTLSLLSFSLYLASSHESLPNKCPLFLFFSPFLFKRTHTHEHTNENKLTLLIHHLMTVIIISLVYLPILVTSFLLPAMITLFKKNIHSFFLALPSNTTTTTATGELQYQPISSSSSSSSGLGIMSATRDRDRPPNVVESAMLKPSSSPPPPSSPNNKIRNSIGFIEEIGGEVDGLMSCTESLGFESSDERRVDINNNHNNIQEKVVNDMDWRSRSRRGGEWRKVRSFPPPLTSLNRNGEPSFFLRPVRKDGRLELTEVRIHRPQILHAERHHGRLTLHLIPDHHSIDLQEEEEEDGEEEEEEAEVAQEQVEEEVVVEEEAHEEVEEQVRVDEEEEEEEEEEEIGYDENEEEGGFGEWRFENEGLRRCHEMVNQHQHQHHHGVHGSHIHHHHHHHHMRMCGISIV